MEIDSFKPSFGSDNHAGVHPKILQAIVDANYQHAPSYGTDNLSKLCSQRFKELFDNQCETFLVFNGTAANVLCLKAFLNSWQSVLCTEVSHLNIDECGAPEAVAGIKLVPTHSTDGKIQLSEMERRMVRNGDQHHTQVAAISITQPTELGTVYSFEEMKQIRAFASEHGLMVHVDGARLTNALISLDCDFKDLYETLRPDAISFGGTKNGLLGCEAVLVFNQEIAKQFRFVRKQNMQLPSKTRFLAAQFLAYFDNDTHKEIASHSHKMAKELESRLSDIPQIEVLHPVESNAVFAKIPKSWTKPLKDELFFYVWDEHEWSVRLMMSFDSKIEEIRRFTEKARQLAEQEKIT